MTYASAAWGHVSKSNVHKLQVIQNKFLRSAFNAPWFVRNDHLHRDAKIVPIKDFLLESATKFFGKAQTHSNPLIQDAVDYDEEGPSRCKRPKMALIT